MQQIVEEFVKDTIAGLIPQIGDIVKEQGVQHLQYLSETYPKLFYTPTIQGGFIKKNMERFPDHFFLEFKHYEESKRWQSALHLIFSPEGKGLVAVVLIPVDSKGMCEPIDHTDMTFLDDSKDTLDILEKTYSAMKQYTFPIASHVVSDFNLWHYSFIQ